MNMMTNFNLLAGEGTANTGSGLGSLLGMLLPFGLVFLVMYFMMIRPQKKQQKKEQEMRNNLRAGDELTTIGGIKGRVLSVKEDTFVMETGNDRTKMTFEKWAIQTVHTKHEAEDIDDDFDDDDDI